MLIRKIIHVDMDAFFAAVEQRDNPRLRGKPVIVGGSPDSRGVVSTCSYEARKFGVHSAMPTSRAKRLCPNGIFLPVRMEAYQHESRVIRSIFYAYTDLVEPLSVDEAFLDVTVNNFNQPSATLAARDIQNRIFQKTGLTASAGVSYNKFIAKIASDFRKPGGLTVVPPDEGQAFIDALPIEKFYGVGKVTAAKFKKLGVNNGYDLRQLSQVEIVGKFGKPGLFYYQIAHGIDERPVQPERARKSLGREVTLAEDIADRDEMRRIISELSGRVESLLAKEKIPGGRTVTLKIRYDDFQSVTRSRSFNREVNSREDIYETAAELLNKTEAGERKIRLVGVTVSNFPPLEPPDHGPVQLTFPF
jgi:DNA polymerase IV